MKKTRWIALLCALVMAMCMLPMAAMADTLACVRTTNGRSVNARSSMLTHCNNRVDSLPNGYNVKIISQTGDWSYVEFKHTTSGRNTRAYVQTRYLASVDSNVTGVTVDGMMMISPMTATVQPASPTGYVNMRVATTKSSKVIEQCRQGKQLTITAMSKDWATVMDPSNGKVGYMMLKFLRY